jgi:hypothetical protein
LQPFFEFESKQLRGSHIPEMSRFNKLEMLFHWLKNEKARQKEIFQRAFHFTGILF